MKVIFNLSTIAIAVVLLLITGIGATVYITPAYAPEPARLGTPAPLALTGVWKSNDGGTYYLRHIGDVVWWIGLSGGNDGRTYSNIFRGMMTTLPVYNNVIDGEFVDVPRGAIMNSGKLLLHISSPTTIFKISGAFGTDTWSKLDAYTPDTKPPFSLTGVWQASDGGTYYLRHIGYNMLWWNGMSGDDGRSFNNVFKGEISWWKTAGTISGEWTDMPRGNIMGSGALNLKITSPTTLQKVSQTGGFGATTWQKVR